MPRSFSWRHRVSDPDRAADAGLRGVAAGADRVALRSAAPGGATPHVPIGFTASRNGSWQVDRQRLIQWLEGFEQEATEEEKRHRLVLQALHDVEAENRSLREELRRRGEPDPASWMLKQEVFARNISSLPGQIAITPGMISVSFPTKDPACGARLLHELSLAMLNDWTAFCRLAGSAPRNTAANTVDRLLEDLEEQMQWGITNERRNPVR
jgi:hypothetical protein